MNKIKKTIGKAKGREIKATRMVRNVIEKNLQVEDLHSYIRNLFLLENRKENTEFYLIDTKQDLFHTSFILLFNDTKTEELFSITVSGNNKEGSISYEVGDITNELDLDLITFIDFKNGLEDVLPDCELFFNVNLEENEFTVNACFEDYISVVERFKLINNCLEYNDVKNYLDILELYFD